MSHAKVCIRKRNFSCAICKQFIALICYHSKDCQETVCPAPLCSNIKYKQAKQRILKSRLATTQNPGTAEAIGHSSPISSDQPSLDNGPLASPDVPQPGIRMAPPASSFAALDVPKLLAEKAASPKYPA